ncbi:hypothetical protein FO470_05515 [Starkeya sp. 3C]|uniref:Uncharacterized protein n=1 Tax=Ancylobacter moscoviensis TaxID=2597768 RepID=A0ABY3DX06_9HYPH|nr:hypothetical protein [Ancylobacter moscoviensis]TSJ64711.1 hypothetical protein FO470_05515 [Ancylobacter moscoviensis]
MSGPDDAVRAERLAAALRENLKRRKQQARGRQAGPAGTEAEAGAAAAPEPGAADKDGGER